MIAAGGLSPQLLMSRGTRSSSTEASTGTRQNFAGLRLPANRTDPESCSRQLLDWSGPRDDEFLLAFLSLESLELDRSLLNNVVLKVGIRGSSNAPRPRPTTSKATAAAHRGKRAEMCATEAGALQPPFFCSHHSAGDASSGREALAKGVAAGRPGSELRASIANAGPLWCPPLHPQRNFCSVPTRSSRQH